MLLVVVIISITTTTPTTHPQVHSFFCRCLGSLVTLSAALKGERCRHPSWALFELLDLNESLNGMGCCSRMWVCPSIKLIICNRPLRQFKAVIWMHSGWKGVRSTLGGLFLVIENRILRQDHFEFWLMLVSHIQFQRHEVATTVSPESLGRMKMATKSGASVAFWSPRSRWFVEHQTSQTPKSTCLHGIITFLNCSSLIYLVIFHNLNLNVIYRTV